MQFIERLFGLYPDAGSGLLEFSLIAILLSAVALRVALSRTIQTGRDTHRPHIADRLSLRNIPRFP